MGKYEILHKLSAGDTTEVYLARVSGAAGFEKQFVFKRIVPELAGDAHFLKMFLDEARIAATLRHANIAHVIDVGAESGSYFYTTEYVQGQDVRAILVEANLVERPVPLPVTLAIATSVSSALGYLHERTSSNAPLGLVHGGVSPANIFVGYDAAIKLADFGVGRAKPTQNVKRKATYTSPEQIAGHDLDPRSDLFSLGIVLYELSTGRHPFGDALDYPLPSSLVASYPEQLEQIVMTLLEPDPLRRYQRGHDVLADLEAVAGSLGVFSLATAVSKYMKELFEDDVDAPMHDHSVLMGRVSTRDYGRSSKVVPAQPVPDEPAPAPDDDAETSQSIKVLGFNPVDAYRFEVLEDLDKEAPPNERRDERTYRRIEELLARAFLMAERGELDKALVAIELALSEEPDSGTAQRLIQMHQDAIVAVLESFIGDPERRPQLTKSVDEIRPGELHPKTKLLLAWIDGNVSVSALVSVSAMTQLETYRHLAQLILRRVVVV